MRFRKNNAALRIWGSLALIAAACILLRRFLVPMFRISCQSAGAALILSPICLKLEKFLSRGPACILSAVIAAGILLALVAVIPFLAAGMYDLSTDILSDLRPFFEKVGSWAQKIGLDISQALGGISEKLMPAAANAAGFLGSTLSGAASLIIALVTAVFILRERERILLHCEMLIPLRFRQRAVVCASEVYEGLMLYLRAQLKISICVGFLSAAALWIAGVPYGALLGIMAGILNVIPYLGPIIAAIPVAISALSVSLTLGIISIGIMLTVQQIDGLIISPRIMGNVTGFPSAVVMIVLFCAGAAFGIAGMLLVLPCMILIRTCVRVFVESGRNC